VTYKTILFLLPLIFLWLWNVIHCEGRTQTTGVQRKCCDIHSSFTLCQLSWWCHVRQMS